MKIFFLGSGDFARDLLSNLLHAGFGLSAVITRPDQRAGRGLRSRPTSVKALGLEEGMSVHQPGSPADPGFMALLEEGNPELLLVADYGYILPRKVLEYPRGGCLNVHPSLLPRLRGAAPIRRALMQGEHVSGVTLMVLDEGLDTGGIIARQEVEVEDGDDELTLRGKLAYAGARMVVDNVPLYMDGAIAPRPQEEALATYADPIAKSELLIDWTHAAPRIHNLVRALSPQPGAYTYFRGKRMKVLQACARQDNRSLPPGALDIADGDILIVGTGAGSLYLEKVQPEGKQPMGAADFVHGYRPGSGEALGA